MVLGFWAGTAESDPSLSTAITPQPLAAVRATEAETLINYEVGLKSDEGMELTSAISPMAGVKVGIIATYIDVQVTRVDPGPPLYLLAGFQIPNVPR